MQLFHLEALAVGAFHHGGVALMSAHGDGIQTAVVLILAMVDTVVHRALDALVGGAGATAVSMRLSHRKVPPKNDFGLSPFNSVYQTAKNMCDFFGSFIYFLQVAFLSKRSNFVSA